MYRKKIALELGSFKSLRMLRQDAMGSAIAWNPLSLPSSLDTSNNLRHTDWPVRALGPDLAIPGNAHPPVSYQVGFQHKCFLPDFNQRPVRRCTAFPLTAWRAQESWGCGCPAAPQRR